MLLKKLFYPLLPLLLLAACQKDSKETAKGAVVLAFDHSVKTAPLDFGTTYTTDLGETYTVNRFRYYINGIQLINDKGVTVPISTEHYLVDHENAASRQLTLTVPEGNYTRLVYTLGVDSARNYSGAQTAALDPLNGMFWTWTSGYIMAKLEGNSPVSTLNGKVFTYHVGGYQAPYATMRKISLPIQTGITVSEHSNTTIRLNADINTWFSHAHAISIAANAACHSPGQLASDLADNYAAMFTISRIQ